MRLAEQASATGQRVELEPMTAVERKIVHEKLKDDLEVETASEGTEPNRYVVIFPATSASSPPSPRRATRSGARAGRSPVRPSQGRDRAGG